MLARTWRGDVLEAAFRAHIAVSDASGRLIAAAGDPDTVTTLRSAVKPLQALPFLRIAADALGATDEEIAIACSSHSGERVHEHTVRGFLRKCGLDEEALVCGPSLPFEPAAARTRLAAGLPPRRIDNGCSGKHAGMLAACTVAGWPVRGYERPDHPLQVAVAEAMSEFLGRELRAAPRGIDGCGLPTYGVSLQALARGFAAGQRDAAFRRAQSAMAAHPVLVAGHGRFDTAVLAVAGDRLTVKGGGAAVWVACLRAEDIGIAIKVESGVDAAVAPLALSVLDRLGVISVGDPRLQEFADSPLRNAAGERVGETRVDQERLAALFDSASSTS